VADSAGKIAQNASRTKSILRTPCMQLHFLVVLLPAALAAYSPAFSEFKLLNLETPFSSDAPRLIPCDPRPSDPAVQRFYVADGTRITMVLKFGTSTTTSGPFDLSVSLNMLLLAGDITIIGGVCSNGYVFLMTRYMRMLSAGWRWYKSWYANLYACGRAGKACMRTAGCHQPALHSLGARLRFLS
jgi:hypothetical protein